MGLEKEQQQRQPEAVLTPNTIAQGLGWFSIALGISEILMPRAVARVSGTRLAPAYVRLYGLRELACGIGILVSGKPKPFLWGRLAGDGLDLAALGCGSRTGLARDRRRSVGAAVNVLGVTALDAYAVTALSRQERSHARERSDSWRQDYATRSGFPREPAQMRGEALRDFVIPRDMATPEALRSFQRQAGARKAKARPEAATPSAATPSAASKARKSP